MSKEKDLADKAKEEARKGIYGENWKKLKEGCEKLISDYKNKFSEHEKRNPHIAFLPWYFDKDKEDN